MKKLFTLLFCIVKCNFVYLWLKQDILSIKDSTAFRKGVKHVHKLHLDFILTISKNSKLFQEWMQVKSWAKMRWWLREVTAA